MSNHDTTCTRCNKPLSSEADDTVDVYRSLDNSVVGSTLNETLDEVVGHRHRRCPC